MRAAATPSQARAGPSATLPAVPKNLVIVESPAKARTIERYLGQDYKVLASYGHVRDLPENPGKGKFGVDVDHDFAPEYVISDDRRKQVSDIEKSARTADAVYLATDLDREGEAIAWHVAEAAHVPAAKTHRVTFSEITESAIREAFAHPRQIDQNLVDAQQTRRIVDRLVGYTLSPLLSRKVRGGLSAGRVQSVAVRLVVEREREINAFTAREYWTIEAILKTAAGERFAAELVRDRRQGPRGRRRGGRRGPRRVPRIGAPGGHQGRGPDAEAHRRRRRSPPRPSSRRPAAGSASARSGRCRSPSGSTRASTPAAGQVGLITYMRTDSTAIAGVAMGEAREVIAPALRRPVHDAQGPGLQDEDQGRPGGPRVDPPDELPARPRFARRTPQGRRAAALPPDLAARDRVADGREGAGDHLGRPGRRPVRAARVGDAHALRRLLPGLHRGPR